MKMWMEFDVMPWTSLGVDNAIQLKLGLLLKLTNFIKTQVLMWYEVLGSK